ncbi:MAG: hypothetical protein J4G13_07980 [Dehalococcoidia bacterium]|nr:hypothetical protein [Dehalococcoidia bacterium]
MTILDKPDITARIATLAQRMGFDGPDASEQVLDVALEYLEDSAAGRPRWRTRQYWDDFSQQNAADLARQGHAGGLDTPASAKG